MRFMTSSALDLIVQVSRQSDGSRRVTSISEVVGMEGNVITLQEIFVFEKKGSMRRGKSSASIARPGFVRSFPSGWKSPASRCPNASSAITVSDHGEYP